MDVLDWVIMGLVTGGWIVSTVYLFIYHGPETFVAWGAVSSTLVTAYHWLILKDSKTQDADDPH